MLPMFTFLYLFLVVEEAHCLALQTKIIWIYLCKYTFSAFACGIFPENKVSELQKINLNLYCERI